MAMQLAARKGTDALAAPRRRARYNAAEQQFSLVLQQRLEDLLRGRRSSLLLVRQYPNDRNRLGAMARETIDFLRLNAVGGPVSQQVLDDGSVIERQNFPTTFPHIVLVRMDRYEGDDDDPAAVTWSIERLQNQHSQLQMNRLIDAASLMTELVRLAG
jgi:hypothetical protein